MKPKTVMMIVLAFATPGCVDASVPMEAGTEAEVQHRTSAATSPSTTTSLSTTFERYDGVLGLFICTPIPGGPNCLVVADEEGINTDRDIAIPAGALPKTVTLDLSWVPKDSLHEQLRVAVWALRVEDDGQRWVRPISVAQGRGPLSVSSEDLAWQDDETVLHIDVTVAEQSGPPARTVLQSPGQTFEVTVEIGLASTSTGA